MGVGLELCGRHKDGREFLIDVMRGPLETGEEKLLLSLIRDPSERDPGKGLRFHLAALVNSSRDAIIGRTMDSVITSWNQSAARIFGYSVQEALGKPISMLLPPGTEAEELDIVVALKRGETINAYDAVRIRKDGQTIKVSVTMSPIFDPLGNLVGASKVAREITERKQMETELEVRHWVRLEVTARENSVVFDIIDSGPGVSPELKARIDGAFLYDQASRQRNRFRTQLVKSHG
jgi:PAS domain S-box-containing protein